MRPWEFPKSLLHFPIGRLRRAWFGLRWRHGPGSPLWHTEVAPRRASRPFDYLSRRHAGNGLYTALRQSVSIFASRQSSFATEPDESVVIPWHSALLARSPVHTGQCKELAFAVRRVPSLEFEFTGAGGSTAPGLCLTIRSVSACQSSLKLSILPTKSTRSWLRAPEPPWLNARAYNSSRRVWGSVCRFQMVPEGYSVAPAFSSATLFRTFQKSGGGHECGHEMYYVRNQRATSGRCSRNRFILFKSDEFTIAPTDPAELMATCKKGRMHVGGWHGWSLARRLIALTTAVLYAVCISLKCC